MNHSWTKIRPYTIQYMFVGGLFVRFPQHDQLASRTAFKALAARRRTARTRRTRGNCLSWTRIGRNKSETYPRLGGKQWPNTFNDVFSMHQMPWEEQLQKNLTNPFAQMIPDLLARSFFFQSGQPTRSASRWPLVQESGKCHQCVDEFLDDVDGMYVVLLLPTILLTPQTTKCPRGKLYAFKAWSLSLHVSYVIKCLMYFQRPSLASSIGHRAHRHEARIGTGPGRFKTWPWNSQSVCKQPPHIRMFVRL